MTPYSTTAPSVPDKSRPSLALKVVNVSKRYRLGEVGMRTISHDLNRLWAHVRGKENPYGIIGVVNNPAKAGGDYVWALQNINFEVERGEIVGIIGGNGAGKSTLLKLLSRVTSPTTGEIKINGRVASLLEVGTGFHPDLTGRENIYLNGAILGMTRREITSRLDEIIEFSGCAKYIDTPVKRYSSGMHVRLAFAVAAHLESDILIVDEVLAVGDAEFQAKCIGKMQDVSRTDGRTVLFVSHNMSSVKQLCPRSAVMDKGRITGFGDTSTIIQQYMGSAHETGRLAAWAGGAAPSSLELTLHSIAARDDSGAVDRPLISADEIQLTVDYTLHEPVKGMRVVATLRNADGVDIFSSSDYHFQDTGRVRLAGLHRSTLIIPAHFLTLGKFLVEFGFELPLERALVPEQTVAFEITELSHVQLGPIRSRQPAGVVHPRLNWTIKSGDNSL
jgi:lipopolysaccharide transport system ATP-binding protein